MAIVRIMRISGAITLLITIFSLSLPAYAKYSDGTGEPNDPYQIATVEDLIWLGESPEDCDKHFILTADVDLDSNLPGRKVFNEAIIGNFSGVFDGNGYTISHMTIIGGGHLGLFGILQTKAEVRNLGVVNVQVLGSGCSVGGLVGSNHGDVTYCYSTGQVNGNEKVGGLVGTNGGEVANSYSCCKISGDSCLGGLVGTNYTEVLYNYSFIVFNGCVTQCYSTGLVSGTGDNIGGLVGDNSSASVCGVVHASFWDVETSGLLASDGGVRKTTAEMQTISNFLEADWDFINETENGTDNVWKIAEGLDYPRLWWEKYSGGMGEPNDPYQIATAEDLMQLGENPDDYNKHFILTTDIDLDPNLPGRKVFEKAVIAPATDLSDEISPPQGIPFSGVFNGNGHKISHLTIRGMNYLGLFGYIGFGAEISSLGLEAVDVNGIDSSIGGLTGCNWSGYIGMSYSTGIVRGGNNVGGLVGDNLDSSITTSFSFTTVTGVDSVGGLVGRNGGDITISYSTGMVQGNSAVGGLVGENWGTVQTCFWDTQTSDQTISDGGTGKTTAEMKTATTFLEAGWDLVDETTNGTEDIWWILEGQDYPRLWWEIGD